MGLALPRFCQVIHDGKSCAAQGSVHRVAIGRRIWSGGGSAGRNVRMHATDESNVSVSDDVPPRSAGSADEGAGELVGALLTASRLFVAIATRSLAAVDGSLTVPQLRMLVVLDTHGPSSLVRLAERLGVNSSNALRMVERLSAVGMIEKAANPNSRREVRLGLTARGRRVVREATEARRVEIGRIVAAMPTERRGDLVTALRAFTDAAGEPTAEVPGWH